MALATAGNAPTQPVRIKTAVELEDGATDVARQTEPPHPVVLAVHEIISGSRANLTGQVRHRRRPVGVQVVEWPLRASSAMQLASVAMEVKLLPVKCESGTRTPMTRSQ